MNNNNNNNDPTYWVPECRKTSVALVPNYDASCLSWQPISMETRKK